MSKSEKYDETAEYWIGYIRGIVEYGGDNVEAEVREAIRRYEEKRAEYYARLDDEGGAE